MVDCHDLFIMRGTFWSSRCIEFHADKLTFAFCFWRQNEAGIFPLTTACLWVLAALQVRNLMNNIWIYAIVHSEWAVFRLYRRARHGRFEFSLRRGFVSRPRSTTSFSVLYLIESWMVSSIVLKTSTNFESH